MLANYFSLAIKNIRHRGIRSWLTLLGIIIGIAAVVAFISLGQGLEEAITGQFSSLSTDRLIVSSAETGFGPPGSTSVRKLTSHDVDVVERAQGIERVATRLIRFAKIEYNKVASFGIVASLPEEDEDIDYLYDSFQLKSEEGRLIYSEDRGKVLLGNDFLENDDFGKDIDVGSTLVIQGTSFEVAGILAKAGNFQINSAIYINEEEMKETLGIGDEVDMIVVQVEDEDRISEVAEDIERKMRSDRDQKEGEEDFSVETPLKALESVNTILSVIQIVVSGIAAISLLIGTIGVANTMFTSVIERTKEIGVMKSIGAKRRDILGIFVIESAALGLIGGIIGAFLGLGLSFLVSFAANAASGLDLLSVTLSWPLLIAAILFALVLGMVAGIIPAFKAARLSPVEALRS